MAISFGKSKEEDVVSLIAAKKYARAIEVLKAQLQKQGANPSLRMQLADVLILADKKTEAVALLLPLADQYARDGFAAKAVSVLKKVQKVDPGRRDVEERLARQIEERQREAVSLPALGGDPRDGGDRLRRGARFRTRGRRSRSASTWPRSPLPWSRRLRRRARRSPRVCPSRRRPSRRRPRHPTDPAGGLPSRLPAAARRPAVARAARGRRDRGLRPPLRGRRRRGGGDRRAARGRARRGGRRRPRRCPPASSRTS